MTDAESCHILRVERHLPTLARQHLFAEAATLDVHDPKSVGLTKLGLGGRCPLGEKSQCVGYSYALMGLWGLVRNALKSQLAPPTRTRHLDDHRRLMVCMEVPR